MLSPVELRTRVPENVYVLTFAYFKNAKVIILCVPDKVKVIILLAGGGGFEPPLTDSESAVLPLNYPPLVPKVGLEPTRQFISLPSQDSVYTNSTTWAW